MKTIIKTFTLYFYLILLSSCSTLDLQLPFTQTADLPQKTEPIITSITPTEKSPFEGTWILKKEYDNEWFAIRINPNLRGELIHEGTLSARRGEFVLDFEKIGNEYWGKLKDCSFARPCKLQITSTNILIIELQYARYKGFRTEENKKNLTPSTSISTSASEIKSPSKVLPTSYPSGYGEISSTTGRPKTVAVKGYYRKDGTYVRSHYRSPPRR